MRVAVQSPLLGVHIGLDIFPGKMVAGRQPRRLEEQRHIADRPPLTRGGPASARTNTTIVSSVGSMIASYAREQGSPAWAGRAPVNYSVNRSRSSRPPSHDTGSSRGNGRVA
jgi:hypothetical protein